MSSLSHLLCGAALLAVAGAAACGREGSSAAQPTEDTAVRISPDNVVVVDSGRIESGPSLSGSLQPERSATVRAEVGGALLEMRVQQGDAVRSGQTLARIEDTALRDAFLSARSAVSTAEASAELARRNLERSERLFDAGAISEREVESARLAASSAASQLADARARLALAQEQLGHTQVRAPFSGVIAERPASAGDVVQPGSPLLTVVDPTSMRLEASVPASQLTAVRVGAPVEFTVNGYPGRVFTGSVTRISPTADPATGQVVLHASLPNAGGDLVAGLFAEGRIGTEARETLIVPLSAIDVSGSSASVLRLRDGSVERVPVQLGLRDEQSELAEIVSGVARGDTLLAGAALAITPGTPVRVQALETPATPR